MTLQSFVIRICRSNPSNSIIAVYSSVSIQTCPVKLFAFEYCLYLSFSVEIIHGYGFDVTKNFSHDDSSNAIDR
jgi:hypothetical protein